MKRTLALLLAILIICALAACGKSSPPPQSEETTPTEPAALETPEDAAEGNSEDTAEAVPEAAAEDVAEDTAEKRVLRVGTLDTACDYHPNSGGSVQKHMVYEGLYRISSGDLEPWLLESFTWTDDVTAVMVPREDVYFSDGDKMTAEDIVYSLELIATDSTSVFMSTFSKIDFEATKINGDGSITLVLREPYGPFESRLFLCYVSNKSAVEDRASDEPLWWDSPVATGPYTVVENVDGSHVTLALREDYWDKENMPDWDEITVYFYTNSTAMFIAFENGEIDLALGVDAKDAARLQSGDVARPETTEYGIVSSNATVDMCMNANTPELQDIKVREAIAHVLNGEDIGSVQYGVLYDADVDSVLAKNCRGYVSQGVYEMDLDYARQCMAESAYPDGFTLDAVSVSTDTGLWEVVQAELAQLNITLNVSFYDTPTCLGLWMKPDGTDLMTSTPMGGNTSLDPDEGVGQFYNQGMLSASRILDEEYNELFAKTLSTTDWAAREAAYAAVQKWLYENFQCIPLLIPSYCYCYDSSVMTTTEPLPSVSKAYVHFLCRAAES